MKKIIFLLLGVFLISCKDHEIQELKPINFDISDPTKYLLVSHKNENKISIYDFIENKNIGFIETSVPADIMIINKNNGLLAYAQKKDKSFYIYNLVNHQEKKYALQSAINYLSFNFEAPILFITTVDKVFALNYQTEINKELVKANNLISINYDPFAQQLLLLTNNKIIVGNNINNNEKIINEYEITDIANTKSALSPDGYHLLFGTENKGIIWNIEYKNSLEYLLKTKSLQPYSDNSSKYFYFIDESGTGIQIDNRKKSIKELNANTKAKLFALGWLDKRLIIVGNEIVLFDTDNLQELNRIPLNNMAIDLFITADSKSAIILTEKNIVIYDMKDNNLRIIELDFIPNKIEMGSSSVLCH